MWLKGQVNFFLYGFPNLFGWLYFLDQLIYGHAFGYLGLDKAI
jgi:hypothetical protein